MSEDNIVVSEKSVILAKSAKIYSDKEWHCTECTSRITGEGQHGRGGGGISGLNNAGYKMQKQNKYCDTCEKNKTHDRWTGERQTPQAPGNLTKAQVMQIIEYYDGKDSFTGIRINRREEICIDHRSPRIRWGGWNPPPYDDRDHVLTDDEIQETFQLLRFEAMNLTKSRKCEKCKNDNQRPSPYNEGHFYSGEGDWPSGIPTEGEGSKEGCKGCFWYDVEAWIRSAGKSETSNF